MSKVALHPTPRWSQPGLLAVLSVIILKLSFHNAAAVSVIYAPCQEAPPCPRSNQTSFYCFKGGAVNGCRSTPFTFLDCSQQCSYSPPRASYTKKYGYVLETDSVAECPGLYPLPQCESVLLPPDFNPEDNRLCIERTDVTGKVQEILPSYDNYYANFWYYLWVNTAIPGTNQSDPVNWEPNFLALGEFSDRADPGYFEGRDICLTARRDSEAWHNCFFDFKFPSLYKRCWSNVNVLGDTPLAVSTLPPQTSAYGIKLSSFVLTVSYNT